MPEHDFEDQVASLYRDAGPAMDDAAFLARVDSRLSQLRRTRRSVLATLGTLGASTTVMVLGRSEVSAIVERWVGMAHAMLADVVSIPWSAAVALVLVSLLILPAFVRSLVDPK